MVIVQRYHKNIPQEHYLPVNPHLSITPKDMERMTLQGKSISTSSLQNFVYFNGDQLNGLPIDMCRGVDMNDIYEASQSAKGKTGRLRTERARQIHKAEQASKMKGGD